MVCWREQPKRKSAKLTNAQHTVTTRIVMGKVMKTISRSPTSSIFIAIKWHQTINLSYPPLTAHVQIATL